MCGITPCNSCDKKKKINGMKKRRRKNKSVESTAMMIGKAALLTVGGFVVSKFVVPKIVSLANINVSRNIQAGSKILLGIATPMVFDGPEAVGAGVGMATAGVVELGQINLPATTLSNLNIPPIVNGASHTYIQHPGTMRKSYGSTHAVA